MQESEPLYVISVASRLLRLHPQTLRKYEREGFVAPSRTSGNLRLYSTEDIDRLRQVKHLVEERGINLAGVQLALGLTEEIRVLQEELRARSRDDYDNIAAILDGLLDLMGASTVSDDAQRGRVAIELRVNRKPR
ncbi:MAG TPA: MerR family transcriptional regulator [Thermomicrobiales bacterium]|jgi:MerR family transcriptional regulator/heat shock protein HspR|nr:MerR family transcriptional regulator [Chloroflexota bacterium]HQX63546.1 MerR family transcriptional regulator [Thermomicrobiales bacterium]HBY45192.1 MerR family transcriptional regulator [Chloroflexota bacterium]HCG29432.1 MerR family transcriptional regulator [Chloroflexota bacterium]HQZ90982.1 MerR family transcriptional regulator [Thermomicrobiales bacterium]